MTDNELIDLLATRLETASATAGWNYIVLQKNQPTQEGIPYEPSIFFEKLFDRQVGWPGISDTYDSVNDVFAENEQQLMETTFQISAWVIQDPTDLLRPTASDVVNYLNQFMKSQSTIAAFNTYNVRMLRPVDVRNPYIEDDRHRAEATPSFDLVLTHQRNLTTTVPAVATIDGGLYPI